MEWLIQPLAVSHVHPSVGSFQCLECRGALSQQVTAAGASYWTLTPKNRPSRAVLRNSNNDCNRHSSSSSSSSSMVGRPSTRIFPVDKDATEAISIYITLWWSLWRTNWNCHHHSCGYFSNCVFIFSQTKLKDGRLLKKTVHRTALFGGVHNIKISKV